MMENNQRIDTVLQCVWQAAKRWGVPSESFMTQQILLFGDSFYGYRFMAEGFAAVWSAADQSIRVYDRKEQLLETFSAAEQYQESAVRTIPAPSLQRAA